MSFLDVLEKTDAAGDEEQVGEHGRAGGEDYSAAEEGSHEEEDGDEQNESMGQQLMSREASPHIDGGDSFHAPPGGPSPSEADEVGSQEQDYEGERERGERTSHETSPRGGGNDGKRFSYVPPGGPSTSGAAAEGRPKWYASFKDAWKDDPMASAFIDRLYPTGANGRPARGGLTMKDIDAMFSAPGLGWADQPESIIFLMADWRKHSKKGPKQWPDLNETMLTRFNASGWTLKDVFQKKLGTLYPTGHPSVVLNRKATEPCPPAADGQVIKRKRPAAETTKSGSEAAFDSDNEALVAAPEAHMRHAATERPSTSERLPFRAVAGLPLIGGPQHEEDRGSGGGGGPLASSQKKAAKGSLLAALERGRMTLTAGGSSSVKNIGKQRSNLATSSGLRSPDLAGGVADNANAKSSKRRKQRSDLDALCAAAALGSELCLPEAAQGSVDLGEASARAENPMCLVAHGVEARALPLSLDVDMEALLRDALELALRPCLADGPPPPFRAVSLWLAKWEDRLAELEEMDISVHVVGGRHRRMLQRAVDEGNAESCFKILKIITLL